MIENRWGYLSTVHGRLLCPANTEKPDNNKLGRRIAREADWTKLKFGAPTEFAKIENGELVFPMTKFNCRMIMIEKK